MIYPAEGIYHFGQYEELALQTPEKTPEKEVEELVVLQTKVVHPHLRQSVVRHEKAFFCPQLKSMQPHGPSKGAVVLKRAIRACTKPGLTPIPLPDDLRSYLNAQGQITHHIENPTLSSYPALEALYRPPSYSIFDLPYQAARATAFEAIRKVEYSGYGQERALIFKEGYPGVVCGTVQSFNGVDRHIECLTLPSVERS